MFNKPYPTSLDLPQSWTRSKTNSYHKNSLVLKVNRINWISLADIPEKDSFIDVIDNLKRNNPNGFLLRGCSPAMALEMRKREFEILAIGQEAIIDLNKPIFNKRTLRYSARSGIRNNSIRKIEFNNENFKKLVQFKRESRHGRKPQLRYLFNDTFNRNTECFIAENKEGWKAAITISHVNIFKAQAELLLRRNDAAPGTMEALIKQVYRYLKKRGYSYFSLGEVPFELHEFDDQSRKSRYLCKVGRAMHFAYNSGTLYKFKNKFSPIWQPLYLCGFPKISLLSLFELGLRTNYFRLIFSQIPYLGQKN